MKLLHYLIPFTLAACGTTTEQPSGCQIISDCKEGRVCLEGICTEEQSQDSADQIKDAEVKPFEGLVIKGTIYATAIVNDSIEAIAIDFDHKVVSQLGANGALFDSAQARHLRNLNRPIIVSEKLIFVNNGEESVLQSYDLVRGDLTTILRVYGGTEIAAKDDTSMFVSTQSHNNEGLDRIVVSEVTLSGESREVAGINANSLFFGYMGVAYDKVLGQLYFTCSGKESHKQEDQDNPSDAIYQYKDICLTFGSQRDGSYHVMTNFKEEGVRMLNSILTVHEFRGSEKKGVFFPCATKEGNGFCSVDDGKAPILEITLEKLAQWLVFDPTQRYAALADGRIYHFDDEKMYDLHDFSFQLNGTIIREIIPFEWKL